jgi:membrane-associated protease RseP (regulator of RpoE activity)
LTLHVLLFAATFCAVTFAGSLYASEWTEWSFGAFLRGWVFSVPLMSILLVHEMGHFLAGRRRNLEVTPPYFLPAPPPLGTFGAFIKIKSFIPDRNALMEVGAAGPLAGSVVAIPMLFVGIWLSRMEPSSGGAREGLVLGSSLLLEIACWLRFGEFSFTGDVFLHPTALASWFGLFVTAMNLLPIGQLDGGHVVYALFGGRAARLVSIVGFCALIPLGAFLWHGWLVFCLIVLVGLGLKHPPPLYEWEPLGPRGRALGWCCVALLILTFVPAPISL